MPVFFFLRLCHLPGELFLLSPTGSFMCVTKKKVKIIITLPRKEMLKNQKTLFNGEDSKNDRILVRFDYRYGK